ncbi:hypothetical protein HPB51_016540 [Rhipicephalus microplus]|uniref:Uncharacterized protein n=1 Tax=Rhipicephalus microplus TaxID=6941 RepID=A0A9J6EI46_RHIMP|nr:hypothetical protein HPB51_016540 [Rhipicephalus microplus]
MQQTGGAPRTVPYSGVSQLEPPSAPPGEHQALCTHGHKISFKESALVQHVLRLGLARLSVRSTGVSLLYLLWSLCHPRMCHLSPRVAGSASCHRPSLPRTPAQTFPISPKFTPTRIYATQSSSTHYNGKRIVLVCVSCLGALSTACLVRLIAHSISALSYSLLTLRHVLHLEDMMTEQDDTKPKTAMFASHNPSKQFNGEARKS